VGRDFNYDNDDNGWNTDFVFKVFLFGNVTIYHVSR
jgi:hypothetical protein